jgi:HEAT repeat protein
MRALICLALAATPLMAQPKLPAGAQMDTRGAASGLEAVLRPLIAAQSQPGWIGYSVASTRHGIGCEYVRDGWDQAGVIHLEPAAEAVILFRVNAGVVERIRALSSYCEIDPGTVPFHWLTSVRASESVAFLDGLAKARERAMGGALSAIAAHSDPAADAALERYMAPGQIESVRLRAIGYFGSYRGSHGLEVLKNLASNDTNQNVQKRAISTLGNCREPEAADFLIATARKNADPELRMAALSALDRHAGEKVMAAFKEAIEGDTDARVKRRAVSSLRTMPDGEGVPLLIQIARAGRDEQVRKHAMTALEQSHDGRAIAFFEEVLRK